MYSEKNKLKKDESSQTVLRFKTSVILWHEIGKIQHKNPVLQKFKKTEHNRANEDQNSTIIPADHKERQPTK